jgi:hypothetical protein
LNASHFRLFLPFHFLIIICLMFDYLLYSKCLH